MVSIHTNLVRDIRTAHRAGDAVRLRELGRIAADLGYPGLADRAYGAAEGLDPAKPRRYRLGTPVEVVSLDQHGLLGRDPTPPLAVEGRVGTIVNGPSYEYDADDAEPAITFYQVMVPGLGTYEFADYELN